LACSDYPILILRIPPSPAEYQLPALSQSDPRALQ
jgi:hypothetical protein